MIRSVCGRAFLGFAASLILAAPASAQLVHSLHVGAGWFLPKGLAGRSADDVLRRNVAGEPFEFDPRLDDALVFEISDFRTGYLMGEWNAAFSNQNQVELGVGIGFSRKSVPSFYRDVQDETGLDLLQRLRLRVVPITGVVRFLPLGNRMGVQPYAGGGVSLLNFSYSEAGKFVDSVTRDVFENEYSVGGTSLGGVVFAGVRVPLRGETHAITAEIRRQFGSGDTGGLANGFLADKIDLGGTCITAGLFIRLPSLHP